MKKLKNKKGFTLIELIVVVAILGIMALILVPSFMGYADDAKTAVNQANARNVWTSAKAAEARSEYITTIDPETYAAGATSGFRTEVEGKLGDAFDGLTAVTVDTTDKVTLATYSNGTIACTFDGTDFGGICK